MSTPVTKLRLVTHSLYLDQRFKVNDGPLTLSSHSDSLMTLESSHTGINFPGWRDAIRSKRSATTTASGVRREYLNPVSNQQIRFRNGSQVVTRYNVGNFLTDYLREVSIAPDSLDDQVQNQALSNFLRKAKDTQRQFQSGVFLGELKEAIRLVRRPLAGIRDLINHYVARVRDRPNRSDIIKYMSQQWLEAVFGILPLHSDIHSAVASLVRLKHKRFTAPVRAYFGGEVQRSSLSAVVDNYAGPYRVERYESYRCSRLLKGEVYCSTTGDFAEVQQSIGFTLMDFIPTVYNLIPYSFLVDYFTNIGQIIESWSFCQGDLAWHCDTFRREGLCDVRLIPVAPASFFGLPVELYSLEPTQGHYRIRSFSRSAPVLGLPTLAFKLPGTSMKWLNIAALAALRTIDR